jgi:ABC-type multidrug transport system fused ATPase/permease subunit
MEADKIFVIHEGQIAEEGSPYNLLQLDDGIFRNLFEHQFQNKNKPDAI